MPSSCASSSALRILVSHSPGNTALERSLRQAFPQAFIACLAYEPAGPVSKEADEIHVMPYPVAGAQAWLDRLDQVLAETGATLLIPTLEAEVEMLSGLLPELARRGLATCLPDEQMLSRRANYRLSELALNCNVPVPDTRAVYGILGAVRAATAFGYPVMVKGPCHETCKARNEPEFISASIHLLAEWGAPAIVQRCVRGGTCSMVGIGDGQGGAHGCRCLLKPCQQPGENDGSLPDLESLCHRLIEDLQWRGPFEIEVIRDEDDDDALCLTAFRPCFPAWMEEDAELAALLLETMGGRAVKAVES